MLTEPAPKHPPPRVKWIRIRHPAERWSLHDAEDTPYRPAAAPGVILNHAHMYDSPFAARP